MIGCYFNCATIVSFLIISSLHFLSRKSIKCELILLYCRQNMSYRIWSIWKFSRNFKLHFALLFWIHSFTLVLKWTIYSPHSFCVCYFVTLYSICIIDKITTFVVYSLSRVYIYIYLILFRIALRNRFDSAWYGRFHCKQHFISTH